ncbi:class I SAM-dependent methyltransferase [Mesorhizobium sp. DCY119]|uniref:class I SAM-dependent methyltransferase n=1 Tax=Mesorhizobium sp. DCY119 TaxID=2108445 RepID=UPI000E723E1F|nr:class I SAM-dependent methyltransferase [Mesorhizobium sp. DCY119]RJG40880.1 class I SAM-dependent methyltransferase [Mesorhizobium sp. DCY119]
MSKREDTDQFGGHKEWYLRTAHSKLLVGLVPFIILAVFVGCSFLLAIPFWPVLSLVGAVAAVVVSVLFVVVENLRSFVRIGINEARKQSAEAQAKSEEFHLQCIDELRNEFVAREKAWEILFDQMAEKVEAARKQARGSLKIEHLANSTSAFNMARFQHFNRTLKSGQIDMLIGEWSKSLDIELTEARVSYLAHRACLLEDQMKGRLATTVETIVLRSVVASATKRKDVSILEIGTLFGIGAAAVYEAAANEADTVHITVIDPLDGYYGADNNDLLTGAKITEATLRQNWLQAPIPEENFTIIKHLSSDTEAMEAASKRKYDVLIIDGDHSYDGVKFDFEHYSHLVRPGGYILFDDYDVKAWPDIKRYVDEEIEGKSHLHLTGTGFRTAVYQVKKTKAQASTTTKSHAKT